MLIGSAVIPIALCLMWKKTNKWGAIAGAVLGQWFGLVAWVIFAKVWAAVGLSLGFGLVMMLLLLWDFGLVCALSDTCCNISNMHQKGLRIVLLELQSCQHPEQLNTENPAPSFLFLAARSNTYQTEFVFFTRHTDRIASTAFISLYAESL